MIWNFEIRNNRLTESLNFYVFTIILTNRYRWIDDIWDNHHVLFQFIFYFFLFFGKFIDTSIALCNFLLQSFCFFDFFLSHHCSDFLRSFVLLCAKCFYFLFDFSVSLVQFNYFINKWKLLILKFIFDVLFYYIRIISYKFDV